MPKRSRQPEEEGTSPQAVKKQISVKNNEKKIRDIRSLSSERTINMLFKAASKNPTGGEISSSLLCPCRNNNADIKCYFCEKKICFNCVIPCDVCTELFCKDCSFLMYDEHECLCYCCATDK